MGGWKDASVVGDAGNAWERAPVVENTSIPVRDIPGAIGRAAKQSALPIAGQLIGTGIGLATAPITGAFALPATIGLESAGGALGEALNQKLGITEPSTNQILMQGAIPGGTRLMGGLMRPGLEIAPPLTKGAEFLNRIAAPEARLTLSRMAAPDAEALFNQAFQSGARFNTGGTLSTIQAELGNLTQGANSQALYGRTIDILKGLEQKLSQSGGTLDPKTYQAELRDLGAALRTSEGRTINQVEAGAIKKVYGALAEGLDAEAGGAALPKQPWAPGQMLPAPTANAAPAQNLLQARQYVKRQAVLDEIEESVGKADKILRGQGDNTQFNAAAVMRDLKNNPFWNGTKGERNPAFTPAEKREIESLFTLLNKLPALQPGAGVNAGSMRFWQRSASMGAGGTAGGLSGDPILAAAGAAVGAALPTMASFGRVLNIALRTETGRAELANLLRQPGATLQSVMTTLTGGATASTATPGPMQRRPTAAMPTPFPQEY